MNQKKREVKRQNKKKECDKLIPLQLIKGKSTFTGLEKTWIAKVDKKEKCCNCKGEINKYGWILDNKRASCNECTRISEITEDTKMDTDREEVPLGLWKEACPVIFIRDA